MSKLTHLRDKVNNREIEVEQSVKSNQALTSKAINPISSDSGTIQEAPFISQATGTANGTVVVDTSPVGKHLEKQGNAIVYNQFMEVGTLARTIYDVTLTPTTGRKFTLNGTASGTGYIRFYSTIKPITSDVGTAGHTFLLGGFDGHSKCDLKFIGQANLGQWYTVSQSADVYTPSHGISDFEIGVTQGTTFNNEEFELPFGINLTKWFNGDIPQDILDTPAHFSRYYNGDLTYNLGEIRFGAGRYLECGQSRNVWDEEWEVGIYNPTTGQAQTDNERIRCKNYIELIPGAQYYARTLSGNAGYIAAYYYDENKNFISYRASEQNEIMHNPSNAKYMRFCMYAAYGTTYNHDITISLYYSTGDSYDKYFPYVAPKIYDTGTEVLRKVGTAKDIKYPNGTIIRSCKSAVYDGVNYGVDITSDGSSQGGGPGIWKTIGNYTKFYLQKSDFRDMINGGLSRYNNLFAYTNLALINFEEEVTGVTIYYSVTNLQIILSLPTATASTVEQANTWLQNNNVTLCYKLATPTTEQGTPFSENVEINDYSYMSWLDTNNLLVNVPQGCKIFYPADYVLFTDSLGQKFEWDVNNIASKDEVEEVACDDYVKVIDYTLDEDVTSSTLTVDLQGNYRKLLIQVVKVAGQSNATANITCRLSNNQGAGFRYAISAPDSNRYTAALIRLDGRKLYCESKLGSYTYIYPSNTRLMFEDVGTKDLTITKFYFIFELAEWYFKAGTQITVWGVK